MYPPPPLKFPPVARGGLPLGGGGGLALIFIPAGGGGPLPPRPPPPLPPQLKCTRKPGFRRMPYTVYILLHVCSIYLVFQTTMPQRSLSVYFSSPVPPLPGLKREDIIDALLYFRFKDRITGHKRQKAEVPADPESVDDEALPNNLSDVSH